MRAAKQAGKQEAPLRVVAPRILIGRHSLLTSRLWISVYSGHMKYQFPFSPFTTKI